MTEQESSTQPGEASVEGDARALLDRVAAAMSEIEQAKTERSADAMRAARTQLAALHGVARLRRQGDGNPQVA